MAPTIYLTMQSQLINQRFTPHSTWNIINFTLVQNFYHLEQTKLSKPCEGMLCNIHNIHVLRYCRQARNDFIYKSCAISIQLQVLFFSIDLDKLYFFLNSTKLIKIALSLLNTKGEGGVWIPLTPPPYLCMY